MSTMILSANDAKYYVEAQTMVGEWIVNAIKKYFSENGELIVAGLSAMSGQAYIPSNR